MVGVTDSRYMAEIATTSSDSRQWSRSPAIWIAFTARTSGSISNYDPVLSRAPALERQVIARSRSKLRRLPLLEFAGRPGGDALGTAALLLVDPQMEYLTRSTLVGMLKPSVSARCPDLARAARRRALRTITEAKGACRPGRSLVSVIPSSRRLEGETLIVKTLSISFARTDLHARIAATGSSRWWLPVSRRTCASAPRSERPSITAIKRPSSPTRARRATCATSTRVSCPRVPCMRPRWPRWPRWPTGLRPW